ncbi:MAG: glycosyltransferase family 4 protein [Candidatus Kaiserbacteria bacterium]|nr:MAG: glycosyltransferase family 4 protein [Candidatus Kaiserbacteria bacterium]
MRLRYIANVRLPTEKAHGIQIMQMCSAFAKAGADVELLVPTRATPIETDPFEYYGVPKNFTIRTIQNPQPRDLWPPLLAKLSYLVPRYTFAWRALKDARANPADAYYVRDEITFRVFGRAGIPSAWEIHDMPRRLSLYKKALSLSPLVVAITHGLKRELVEAGVAEKTIAVEPDGADTERFARIDSGGVREKLGLRAEDVLIAYVGGLYPWKGVPTLIAAAEGLPKEAYVLIVGGGAELEATQKSFGQKAIRGAVLGPVSPTEAPRYIVAADVFVIPNSGKEAISRSYTSPLKLFEALAAGRAIVASDLPSLREILDEKSAVLVPPDDPAALREALGQLVRDPERRAKLQSAAGEKAHSFDWKERAKRILARLS